MLCLNQFSITNHAALDSSKIAAEKGSQFPRSCFALIFHIAREGTAAAGTVPDVNNYYKCNPNRFHYYPTHSFTQNLIATTFYNNSSC